MCGGMALQVQGLGGTGFRVRGSSALQVPQMR